MHLVDVYEQHKNLAYAQEKREGIASGTNREVQSTVPLPWHPRPYLGTLAPNPDPNPDPNPNRHYLGTLALSLTLPPKLLPWHRRSVIHVQADALTLAP